MRIACESRNTLSHGSFFCLDFEERSVPTVSFWCQRCSKTREDVCPEHGKPTLVRDSPILSRAMASLPAGLVVSQESDQGEFVCDLASLSTATRVSHDR